MSTKTTKAAELPETDDVTFDKGSEEDAILQGLDDLEDAAEPTLVDEAEPEVPDQEIKAPRYNPKELIKIFDEILFEGSYKETSSIKGKIDVVFRTRSVGEANKITRQIDSMNLKTMMSLQNHTDVLTTAYALVNYQNKDFTDAEASEKYEFINGLPEPILIAVSQARIKFDQKVGAAVLEGEENF
jgi:hypothetical protein